MGTAHQNGTCDVNIVMTAELTNYEVLKLQHCEEEYSEFKFWPVEDVIKSKRIHIALKNAARALQKNIQLEELRHAVQTGGCTNAVLALMARKLFAE